MSKFDESKVINSLHIEEAKIGKKYYFEDNLHDLKDDVENENLCRVGKLSNVVDSVDPFTKDKGACWEYIYPYEEPPKKRMTNRQLSKWISKGHGEYSIVSYSQAYLLFSYVKGSENEEVDESIIIRTWDSDEWIEPTVDIYERDCK